MRWCFLTLLAAIVTTPVFLVHAQTCGNLITPSDFYYEDQEEESYPISDCENPFGRTGDLNTLKLGSQTIVNNGVYNIEVLGTSNYGFADETYNNPIQADYYLHSGSNFVRIDTQFEQPTEAAYEAEVINFFNGN